MAANGFKKYVSGFEFVFPNPRVEIHIDLEQAPDPDSVIRLSDQKDALGLHRAKIDWKISELERKTARIFAIGIGKVLERLNLGTPDFAPWLFSNEPITVDDLHGNYHFIGATRMADAPENGVVDANCRSFGIPNLFFAGCSVFPTGGHANPTLTIVALAIRLADFIRAEAAALKRGV